eukprot:1159193-Pelagomonas_calceolata.AAC.1
MELYMSVARLFENSFKLKSGLVAGISFNAKLQLSCPRGQGISLMGSAPTHCSRFGTVEQAEQPDYLAEEKRVQGQKIKPVTEVYPKAAS